MLVCNGTLVVTAVKFLEIEFSTGSFAGPETQIVGSRSIKSRNWDIIGDSLDDFTTFPGTALLTLRILILSYMAVELDLLVISVSQLGQCGETHIYNNIMSWKLPWIEVKPVIGDLNLVSIHNLLLKNTISVSQSITPSWVVEGRQRVQETSS